MSKSFVIKCGGSTLTALPESFFADVNKLQEEDMMPVIVHGGGPAITEALTKMGVESEFVHGLRKTSEQVLDVVEMVLSGQINKEIVRKIQLHGARAIGISGVDGELLYAEPVANAAEIGYVGNVTRVHESLIRGIVALGYLPVIAPVAIGEAGQRFNINADTAAGAVASALGVQRMIVVTDVPGIMRTINGEKEVMASLTTLEIENMIGNGQIYGGMIPKVRAAIQCIQGKVEEVLIVNGAEPAVLSRVLSGEPLGTRIIR